MKKLCLWLIPFMFFMLSQASAQSVYRFASIAGLADQEIAAKMMSTIFKDAKLTLEVEPMPAERARVEATEGRKDGDLGRIASYGEHNPTMLRVPTPYASAEIATFALASRKISIKSIDELKKYKIVIVRGVQTSRDIINKLPGHPSVHEMTDLAQIMQFIATGRADVAITSEFAGLLAIKKQKLDTIAPAGIINSLPLYMYFHPRHKDVVPIIDAAISARVKTGELKKWREQYKQEYLNTIK